MPKRLPFSIVDRLQSQTTVKIQTISVIKMKRTAEISCLQQLGKENLRFYRKKLKCTYNLVISKINAY